MPVLLDYAEWSTAIPTDVYGAMLGGWTIKEGLRKTIEKWLPSYIAEFNRQVGAQVVQVPVDYQFDPENRPEPLAPGAAIVTGSNGTIGDSPRQGDGTIYSRWSARVQVYVFGTTDWNETEALTYAYAALVRGLIMQHPSLDVGASSAKYVGEHYFKGEQTIICRGMAEIDFSFVLPNLMDTDTAPSLPSVEPADDYPVVSYTGVTEIDEEAI